MAPPKFADIAKGPLDLLNEDYASKVGLKCKKAAGPVQVTLDATQDAKTGAISSKIGTKFVYAGLNFDKLQFEADGAHTLETSLSPYPGFSLSFKGNKAADLGLDYCSGRVFTTTKLDVKSMSAVSNSATIGLKGGVILGGDVTYAMSGKTTGITSYNIGASYATGPLFAAVTTANKLADVNVAVMYKVNNGLTLASSTTHSSAKPLQVIAVGGLYKSSFGDIKAKVGSNGVVSASLIKEIAPKVTLTASGSVSKGDLSTLKYGFGIVM